MFNKFVYVVFNASILIPFIFAVGMNKVWIGKDIIVGLVAIIISLALVIAQLVIVSVAKKQMVAKRINLSKVSQDKENWSLVIYTTYFVPFIESCFGDSFTMENWIIVFVGIILLTLNRKTISNPVLQIMGYKFYLIETKQGVDMTLITRKELRNKNSLSSVIRLFEYYVMEI